MREKFCPKCGKKTEKLYEGLCEVCFLSKFSFLGKLSERLEVKECVSCGRFFFRSYSSSNIEELIEGFFQQLFREEELNSLFYRIADGKIYLTLNLKTNDLEKSEEKVIDLKIKKITCQACFMKSSGYFQAVLQVRAPKDLLEKIKDEIESQINYLNQYDRLAFISSLKETKNGFDVFIGSKNSAHQIARILKSKFMAKVKITRKIGGRVRGKKVYRDTILISIS
ncbi:MAG: NMD3-related protein [Candidatus Aenigmatarchaeota archaeon]